MEIRGAKLERGEKDIFLNQGGSEKGKLEPFAAEAREIEVRCRPLGRPSLKPKGFRARRTISRRSNPTDEKSISQMGGSNQTSDASGGGFFNRLGKTCAKGQCKGVS